MAGSGDVVGIVLAAGAGTRMGRPKALVIGADGVAWVTRACSTLLAAGCSPVLAVLGAGAGEARALVPGSARVVVAGDWAEGMSASLRAGLLAAQRQVPQAAAALVMLVDTPGVGVEVASRMMRVAATGGMAGAEELVASERLAASEPTSASGPMTPGAVAAPGAAAGVVAAPGVVTAPGAVGMTAVLARAVFKGRPGHPVLLGREHWAAVIETATGDAGARAYLTAHEVTAVECGELGTGDDADTPEDLHQPDRI